MTNVSRRTRFAITAMCAVVASAGLFSAVSSSHAIDPGVILGRAFINAIKRATVDRAQAVGAVNANRDQALQELDERRAVADYFADKGWISPEEHDGALQQIDQLSGGVEDLARRERQIVRHDTAFMRNLARNVMNSLTANAPQILAENLGLPPEAARTLGSILQGQRPLAAALDTAIARVSGQTLVDPSKGPLDDLRAQIDALEQATSALRGTSRIKLVGELLGVQDELERISLLPRDQQESQLGSIRRVIDEVEGVLTEAGAVRDSWLPSYSGPNEQRFARDSKRQAILEELRQTGEPDLSAAVIAGMAAQGRRTIEELIDQLGIDPTSVDADALASTITRLRAEALARGERPTTEELARTALGDSIPGGGGGDPAPTQAAPTQPSTTQPPVPTATRTLPSPTLSTTTPSAAVTTAAVPSATQTQVTSTPSPAASVTPTPSPTLTASPSATPSPTPTPTDTPSPTATTASITNFAGSWTSAGTCDNAEAPFRWTVSLSQSGASVSGTITFHACPGGGRVNYSVTGTATAAPTITLQGTISGGAGPLGGSAPSSQSFTLTKNGAPSPNLAG